MTSSINLSTLTEMAQNIVFQAKAENNMNALAVTERDLEIELDCEIMYKSMVFESKAAEVSFKRLLMSEVKKVCPIIKGNLYPDCHMDARGNYTYDSSKWA